MTATARRLACGKKLLSSKRSIPSAVRRARTSRTGRSWPARHALSRPAQTPVATALDCRRRQPEAAVQAGRDPHRRSRGGFQPAQSAACSGAAGIAAADRHRPGQGTPESVDLRPRAGTPGTARRLKASPTRPNRSPSDVLAWPFCCQSADRPSKVGFFSGLLAGLLRHRTFSRFTFTRNWVGRSSRSSSSHQSCKKMKTVHQALDSRCRVCFWGFLDQDPLLPYNRFVTDSRWHTLGWLG